jgi:hypothetical protein
MYIEYLNINRFLQNTIIIIEFWQFHTKYQNYTKITKFIIDVHKIPNLY